MGYTNVRHYRGGIAEWKEAGLPLEKSTAATPAAAFTPEPLSTPQFGPAPGRRIRFAQPTVSRRQQWGNSLLDLIERLSTAQLFFVWLAMVLMCGSVYWLTGFSRAPGLIDRGAPIAGTLGGLLSALYFSFVTTTSVGYGDVLPIGPVRVLSVVEAVIGLLIFGALIAKFVSRRQDELVRDIYRVTFETRLDRVQTNLHLVLSELQSIAATCDDGGGVGQPQRVAARLESAVLVCGAELRAIHSLLYSPQHAPEESALEAILVGLASVLGMLSELLTCLPPGFARSATLQGALKNISSLAEDICAECVPPVYAPALTVWMDRVQQTARMIT